MPEMEPRLVRIGALLQALTAEEATFHVTCGKGTYIRSLARDMARQLGTVGHVSMLRRLAVGPFTEASSISLDFLQTLEHSAAAFEHMHPVVSALDDIPAFPFQRTRLQGSVTDRRSPSPVLRHRPGLRRSSQMWLQLPFVVSSQSRW